MTGLNFDCDTNVPSGDETAADLSPEQRRALEEALRCLGARSCEACDLCRLLCPDLAITRDPDSGAIRIDLDYCKGCGICAAFCPRDAIRMEPEAGGDTE